MPVSLQLAGEHHKDEELLEAARLIEEILKESEGEPARARPAGKTAGCSPPKLVKGVL